MPINLYSHQSLALKRLKNGSILCGGVGSGKSRTAIAYYYIKQGGDLDNPSLLKDPKDLYIITTARKRDTFEWDGEMVPFLLSTDEDNPHGNKVCVDSWNNIKKYSEVSGAFFIFDEQRVVGSGAWVKAFLKIAKSNDWILLSATPGDTWLDYIPVFIANGFYKNRTAFMREHVIFSRFAKYPKVDRYISSGKLIRLKKQILVNMEYKKPAVRHSESIFTEFDKDLYSTAMKTRWDFYKDEPVRDAAQLCYLLRRIVNSNPDRINQLEKLSTEHKRIIVFYNFNYELELLRELGEKLKIPYSEWNGHKHEDIPDSDKWLYFVQYTAGAEGWNCITTNVIVFYSQNYSYKSTIQAAGRIDRMNTPYKVLYYYHFKSYSTIDSAISKSLKKKKDFNASTFVG